MGKEKQSYYCFLCGRPMEELPHLSEEMLLTLITRHGCQRCNIVQEKNDLLRELSPHGFHLNYEQYQKKLKTTEK